MEMLFPTDVQMLGPILSLEHISRTIIVLNTLLSMAKSIEHIIASNDMTGRLRWENFFLFIYLDKSYFCSTIFPVLLFFPATIL